MASLAAPTSAVGPDTLITVKVLFDETNRRFKLPLRDLGARVFPLKVRFHRRLKGVELHPHTIRQHLLFIVPPLPYCHVIPVSSFRRIITRMKFFILSVSHIYPLLSLSRLCEKFDY